MRFARTQLTQVEFWADGEWSDLGVIWPEEIFAGPRVPADDSSER
jgi:hypothetical protein